MRYENTRIAQFCLKRSHPIEITSPTVQGCGAADGVGPGGSGGAACGAAYGLYW